jgi:hypothetical protein
MRNRTLSLGLFVAWITGCAAHGPAPARPPAAAAKPSASPAVAKSDESSPKTLERRVGDYMVHMISGSFRKQPALFTERVLAREHGVWIIELMLEESAAKKTLRAFIDDNGEVVKVTAVGENGEVPAKLADYEALIASVSVVPDENEGLAASKRGTCTVGPTELDCETKSYRVRLGERAAELGITRSPSLPDSDIGGEITLSDGTVIFRSELVEHGNAVNEASDSFALLDGEKSVPAPK